MSETVNQFLLSGDKFKHENLHSQKTGDVRYIHQNELNKTCFQHEMAYGNLKDLNRKTVRDKAFNIAKNPKYDGC